MLVYYCGMIRLVSCSKKAKCEDSLYLLVRWPLSHLLLARISCNVEQLLYAARQKSGYVRLAVL